MSRKYQLINEKTNMQIVLKQIKEEGNKASALLARSG